MQIGRFANYNFGIRALAQHQDQTAESLEKLSTGKAINRASDDPAGMVAAEGFKVRIYSINAELKAFNQTESYLGAKEGGLSVINEKTIELNELVVRAANTSGNSTQEQDALKLQISSVLSSMDTIAQTTTFKGRTVLSEYTTGSIADGLGSLATLAFEDPEDAQRIAQEGVDRIARTRGAIGNELKEIDSKRSALNDELINLTGSLSSIEDTDYAAEAAKLVRSQILEQASVMAIDINRQSAQQVLGLLKDATQTIKANA